MVLRMCGSQDVSDGSQHVSGGSQDVSRGAVVLRM